MSWVEQTLRERRLGSYRRAYLECRSERVEHVEAVREALASFGGDGWICECSTVVEYTAGEQILGIPLSAELARRDEPVSLHVRQVENGWQLVWISELARSPDGELHWIESVELAGHSGTLRYDTAWRRATGDAFRPWLSRFAGRGARA